MYSSKNEPRKAYQMLQGADQVTPNSPDILLKMAECLPLRAPLHERARVRGVVAPRARQHRGQARALGCIQARGRFAEEALRGGFGAVDTITELDDVRILEVYAKKKDLPRS
jgi:hypothetical protein